MNIRMHHTQYSTEVLSYLKVFYPLEKIEVNNNKQPLYEITIGSSFIEVIYCGDDYENLRRYCNLENNIRYNDRHISYIPKATVTLKGMLYDLCSKVTGIVPTWGVLTGIRPSKLAYKLCESYGQKEAVYILEHYYKVNSDKVKLLVKVVEVQKQYFKHQRVQHSVYIGIPFCPTRCSYCSFTSQEIKSQETAYKRYVDVLIREMVAKKDAFKHLRSIYIGGGTPTSLTEDDFNRLLCKTRELLGNQKVEFTVEAGRADTITEKKLISMQRYGVNRISINPQTMQDKTLVKIGRGHNVQTFIDCVHMARRLGFDHINMDIILGLPGEKVSDVEDTIRKIMSLEPESITIHTMALKRGARLLEDEKMYRILMKDQIDGMLKISQKIMEEAGYGAYYLYRQKNMIGNYENIGYCKEGYGCIYNIHTMEEKESIVAFGAGAISKKVTKDRLVRKDHPKDVKTYLDNIDDIISANKVFWEK
ncbi:coproporphyrinogen dehydrogenase HemZ [Petrocella sp. FN5]|uniref:coproporphyrinogen dehydrogenase HemZ n=1 Tax=Petrocella sp. FN5 TaxID=3032002 RepID=UPI0023D9A1E4|nr:coproporphyrinogen dehydrogenase HemZ [Petrocella sp. FN5]MDF1617672.1 coproporphyrinogen dehydrogenase HemZ [Petrocella sp. FN5]